MLNMQHEPRQEQPFGIRSLPPVLVPISLVVLTAGLRLWRIEHGLPDFLEEAIPFKRAFAMWGWETGRTDLNPHFFNYPSLSIYLHFLLQKIHYGWGYLTGQYSSPSDYWLLYHLDPTPQVVLARLVGIGADCASVWGVWAIGERLHRGVGVVAALMLAFTPTLILTARSIYTDSFMAALGTWAVARMLAYQAQGGRGRLVAALVLIGLAAGTKYTAGLLVLPLGWVLWNRHGWPGLKWWPAAAAICGVIFLLSSPYVLLDFKDFWHDFSFERQHMATGHLGSLDQRGAGFQLTTLIDDLGVTSLLLLLTALLLTFLRRRDPVWPAVVTLWLVLLPQAVSVGWFRMEAARYLLPILPVATVLIAWAMVNLVLILPAGRRRLATALLVGLALLPVTTGGLRAAATGTANTQQLARQWCTENLTRAELIVQESYGAKLNDIFALEKLRGHPAFPGARQEYKQLFISQPWHRSVTVPMAVSGQIDVTAETVTGHKAVLPLFVPASELNQVFYLPALYLGTDYFVTSGAVRQRYEDNPARFPRQVAFYRWLEDQTVVAIRFQSGHGVDGPRVTIFDLRGQVQEGLRRQEQTFNPYWWLQAVPLAYRMQADSLLTTPDRHSGGKPKRPDGKTASWVLSLHSPFNTYLLPFCLPLAQHLVDLGRFAAGRHHSAAILAMRADLALPCFIYSVCATGQGDWESAEQALKTSINALLKREKETAPLRYELARVLAHQGKDAAARHELERIVGSRTTNRRLLQRVQHLLASGAFADSLRVRR